MVCRDVVTAYRGLMEEFWQSAPDDQIDRELSLLILSTVEFRAGRVGPPPPPHKLTPYLLTVALESSRFLHEIECG